MNLSNYVPFEFICGAVKHRAFYVVSQINLLCRFCFTSGNLVTIPFVELEFNHTSGTGKF